MTANERCDRPLSKKRKNPVDKSAALFILALSVASSLKLGMRTHKGKWFLTCQGDEKEGRFGKEKNCKEKWKDILQRTSRYSRADLCRNTLC